VAHRQCGTTAGITVRLGKDHTGERQRLVEGLAVLAASWPVMASTTNRFRTV
jgi:hypothetical protein